jgi:RNA polymerase sigma factor for flagellar operon FliA
VQRFDVMDADAPAKVTAAVVSLRRGPAARPAAVTLTHGLGAGYLTGGGIAMETSDIWRAFACGDDAARERLLREHLGLVHFVARQVARRLSEEADFDELVSAGTIGLVNALESFDTGRGLAFSTFAAPRIRGAILDELRRQDHVPRSVRRKAREIGAARDALTRTHSRTPDDREVAALVGVDLPTLWRWQADVENAVHVPLDRPAGAGGTPSPSETLAGDEGDGIDALLTHHQEVAVLRDAILTLKEQERTVLALYYFEELKLHEIAKVLELTESRVSQIRSKAVQRLRVALAPMRGELARAG